MRTLSFPCWASAGKCDDTYWEWDFDITDEEFVRLKKAADEGESFCDCVEVADIYKRLYSEMIKEQAAVYLGDNILYEQLAEDMELEDEEEVSEAQVIDYLEKNFIWRVEFPEDF